MKLSVVIPVYGAENILNDLIDRIVPQASKISDSFEIILVNDRSPDNSWGTMKEICAKDNRVKGVLMSRNFGQHSAIHAGLTYATGEWVIVMDCDLQDQPEEFEKLYTKAKEGFKIVLARRKDRTDGFFKRAFSKMFYQTLGFLTDTIQTPEVANYGIYHIEVIRALLSLNDYTRYFPTMIKWVGFNTAYVDVQHANRHSGNSSYNLKKLLRLALNVILSFSDKPLRLTIKVGLLFTILSLLYITYNLYLYFTNQIIVLGYTSMIFSIWFVFGVLVTIIGTIGLYIGKIFDQVKNRPIFIVDEQLNIKE